MRTPAIGLQRRWDEFDAYLFDVDGTLINCRDAVHYFAFCEALKLLSGRNLNLDGVTTHGNTDIGILRDALRWAGYPEPKWRSRLTDACDSMCSYVRDHRHEICAVVLPSVREVLDHLLKRGALLGIATGNLEGIGTVKLEACGLLRYFHFHAFSDGLERRDDVYQRSIEKAQLLTEADIAICAVGDTPADILAARTHGVDIIAVATGIHSQQQLSEVHPNLCVASLAELACAHAPNFRRCD